MTDTDQPKGLMLELFRTPLFGANPDRNLLAAVNEVTLVEIHWADGRKTPMPKNSRVFPATPDSPAVALVERKILGTGSTWHIAPVGNIGWVMAGGTYAATTDSRLGEITHLYGALSVHDWKE